MPGTCIVSKFFYIISELTQWCLGIHLIQCVEPSSDTLCLWLVMVMRWSMRSVLPLVVVGDGDEVVYEISAASGGGW